MTARAATQTAGRGAKPHRDLVLLSLFALASFALLVWLGVWQLQRLAWKEGVLARIVSRIHAPPVALAAPEDWSKIAAGDYEYTRVSVRGAFDHTKEIYVFRPASGNISEPGYHVFTPLRIAGGDAWIIVNRGYVPERLKAPATRAAGLTSGEVAVTGLLRTPETRSTFTPADDKAQKLWFTRDPVAMARAMKLGQAAPFSIDADASSAPGGWPKGGATVISVPNDHLSYALTWFGLAATLAVMYALFVWRRGRT